MDQTARVFAADSITQSRTARRSKLQEIVKNLTNFIMLCLEVKVQNKLQLQGTKQIEMSIVSGQNRIKNVGPRVMLSGNQELCVFCKSLKFHIQSLVLIIVLERVCYMLVEPTKKKS